MPASSRGWRGQHRDASFQIADQPPSEGRIAPLMLVLSRLRRKVIDAASWAACAVGGSIACINGTMRSCARVDANLASMFVSTGPGAIAFTRNPYGPYITAELRVMPIRACFEAV